MNEINFFEQNKKKLNIDLSAFDFKYKRYLIPAALIGVLGLFVISTLVLNNDIDSLTKEYNDLIAKENLLLQNQDNENLIVKANSELEQKQQAVQYIENIGNLNNVSSVLIEDIKDSIPSSLFLKDFSIIDDKLVITGYALSANSVAKFQNNLLKTDRISEVFVSDITNELGNYNFTLTAKVRS